MSTMISPNLPTIPRELLLQIIHPSQFPTAKSLLPILQTNKHLYTTLIPHLYRKITIHSHSPRQRYPLPLSRLSRTLIIYPERRSWVREVHILFNSNLDPQRGARWVENAVDLVLTLCELKSLRIESLKRCDWPGTCEGFLDNCWKLGSLRDFVIMNVRLVPAQLRTLQRIPQLESLYISGLDLPPYGEGDDDVNGINPRRSMLISSLDKLEIELSVFDLRSTNGGIFDPFQNLTRLILMSEGYLFKETTQPAESLARILRPLREKLVYLHLSIWRVWNKERMQISFTDFSVLKELKIHDYLAFGPTIQKYIWQLPKIYARSDLAARLPSSLEELTVIFEPHVSPMRHIRRLGGFKPSPGLKPSMEYAAGYEWILELGEEKRSGRLGSLESVRVLERKGTRKKMSSERRMDDRAVHYKWDVPREIGELFGRQGVRLDVRCRNMPEWRRGVLGM